MSERIKEAQAASASDDELATGRANVQITLNEEEEESDAAYYCSLPVDMPGHRYSPSAAMHHHHGGGDLSLLSNENEDSSESFNADSDTNNEADTSLDILCMSPPQTRIQMKPRKPKKPRLVHSAALPSAGSSSFGESALGGEESTSDLVDSLADLQARMGTGSKRSSICTGTASSSIPSAIKPDSTSNPNRAIETRTSSCLTTTSGDSGSLTAQRPRSPASKRMLPRQNNKKSVELDPFEREESYMKISGLLKLALSNKPECAAPPPTPMPSSSSSSLSPLISPFFHAVHHQHQQQQTTTQRSASTHSANSSSSSVKSTSKFAPSDEMLKKQLADNVWKHLFDYFVFYKDRSTSEEMLEARLREKRSIIPNTIREISATSFTSITMHMNNLIKTHMRSPADYSKLYEHRAFIDQLCYLFWLVEDILNQVGYIESLYPSVRLLKEDQPAYADPNFEGTVKTLLLWYKIMHDLMSKCDVLGLFLGFGKRPESKQYWTWFDQRLKYSRNEYELVKKWLDDSFLNISSGSYNTTLHDDDERSSEDEELATLAAESRAEAGETISALQPPTMPARFFKHSPTKTNRQVSFELKASNSASNLLYNNIETPSIIDSSSRGTGGGPFSFLNNNNNNSSEAARSDANRSENELSSGSVASKSAAPEAGPLTVQALAAHLFSEVQDSAAKSKSKSEPNDHLMPVKLHHLQSYISRSSSYISNNTDSPVNGNGSFSSSIYSSLHEMSLNDTAKSRVAFGLHDEDSCLVSPANNTTDNLADEADAAGLSAPTPTALTEIHAASHIETQATLIEGAMAPDDESQEQQPQSTTSTSDINDNREKIYQEFLHKRLRKHGLTKTCDEIRQVILDALPHALQALQVDYCERHLPETLCGATFHDQNFYYHLMPVHRKCREYMAQFPSDEETLKYGVSGEWFKRLNLPSPRPLYLYLSNVILDLMNACIRMQISSKSNMKKQSNFKFSLLSIEVLTHECRECIEQAILVRQFYSHMVFSVFVSSEMDVQSALENDMLGYDENLKQIIEIYLTFITDWVHDLVANTSSYKALEVLNEEWKFCKNNLYFVTGSEDMYAKRFCTLCSLVNDSLGHSLSDIDTKHKQPLMEYISNEETMMSDIYNNYDSLNSESGLPSAAAAAGGVGSSVGTGGGEDSSLGVGGEQSASEYDDAAESQETESVLDLGADGSCPPGHNQRHRYSFDHDVKFDINLRCNIFKEEINKLRKRSMKALEFCSSLINDLELAAKYSVSGSIQSLLNELKSTNHVLVSFMNPELQMSSFNPTPSSSNSSFERTGSTASSAPTPCGSAAQSLNQQHSSPSFMIFVPYEFSKDKIQIVRLLFLISAKDDMELGATQPPASSGSSVSNNDSSKKFTSATTVAAESPTSYRNSSNKPSVVRRLSSSNSFIELNELQRDKFLHRLSKIADLKAEKTAPLGKITGSGASSPTETPNAFLFSPLPYSDGYLLFVQLPKDFKEQVVWTGAGIKLHASMPVRRSLYQHKSTSESSASLLLVVPRPSILSDKRIELKTKLKCISLVKEKTSFHPNIENAIDELKDNILNLRDETIKCIKSIETDLKTSVHYGVDNAIAPFQQRHTIEQRSLSEIWRVSYNFGIELQNECMKFMTQDRAKLYSQGLAEFCIMWCDYIIDKTERGKGRTVRPWAAKKGLYLMNLAWQNSSVLDDDDFYKLKVKVESCLLHVIGGRKAQPSLAATAAIESSMKTSQSMMMNQEPVPASQPPRLAHQNSLPQLSDSKENVNASGSSARVKRSKLPPSERFSQECSRRDKERESVLLGKRYIGKILVRQRPPNLITATEVSFRWQLGLQVGQGQYGKVYSCVNLDTGEPMAMKEIPFKSNDIETIKGIADEINNVQGINHENLVKFYGAELHRKEILIFMEFCGDQSTLDRISREASGLPEKIVRDYTKSLLKAVETLHENKIMHRDIKGANIFLKAIDPKHPEKIVLKLGDFGCSIKFKDPIGASNKNIKATGFMGTFPFMAPEVMTSEGAIDAGYTFVADIWSLGCVVIEMFTGKRPWHPMTDENIMYVVHILKEPERQKRPPYPSNNISEEAIDFLNHCLEFEPSGRYTADQLLDHPFVKVELVDDK